MTGAQVPTAQHSFGTIRRGLPRTPGGEPWPPAAAVTRPLGSAERDEALPATGETVAIRRGLPRVVGGEPWPATAPPRASMSRERGEMRHESSRTAAPAAPDAVAPAPTPPAAAPPAPRASGAWQLTRKQWWAAAILVGLAVVGTATIVTGIARAVAGLDPIAAFVAQYPGTYELPEDAPVGLPAWLNWSHFFNFLLIALIIRSGLQVRGERNPSAYFTSKRTGKKSSLRVWLHTSLDVLWVANGLVFVILLFATGQWMRIVPTSWEVFPHAISAALQYAALDWPVEDGWVNYNALQQLSYFVTVFIAAPLAVVSGVRMSAWWPQHVARLHRVYPVEWARAVHFPTMLYFIAFIVVHVLLVFTTGALRNLNHMFAARDHDDWVGFLWFTGSLLVVAAAWIAARPTLLVPIAQRFGTVSSR